MGVTDPRKLVVILHDLEQELERWAMKSSDMLRTAQFTQNIRRERVERTWRRTRMATEQYYEDQAVYNSRKQNVHELILRCDDNVVAAKQLLSEVEEKVALTERVLEHWNAQLQQAIQWRDRAIARVQRAEADLAAAQRAYDHAVYQLRSAEADLRNCRNSTYTDNQGRERRYDCSNHERNVAQARTNVSVAEDWVRRAQIELQAARAELDRARRRVTACTQSVQLAQQGKQKASESHDRAHNALSQAERSLDHARAAQKTVEIAGDGVDKELETVEEMNVQIQLSDDRLVEAQIHLVNSTKYEESAQRYRIMTRAELQFRTEMLYALNRPELLGGITGVNIALGTGTFIGGVAEGVPSGSSSGSTIGTKKRDIDPTTRGIWLTYDVVMEVEVLPDVLEYEDEKRQQKLPLDALRVAMQNLTEMLPLIQEGIGTNPSYWMKRDQEEGKSKEMGYAAAYTAFYGERPIIVAELADESMMIKSGGERIWLAKQMNISYLPIKLMRQPAYAIPVNLMDEAGNDWELLVFDAEDGFKVRIFNTTKRAKIPDTITDGDGICIDVRLEKEGDIINATMQRFEISDFHRDGGFAKEAVSHAETVSKEKGASGIYLSMPGTEVANEVILNWYIQLGYQLNREGQIVVIYKDLLDT